MITKKKLLQQISDLTNEVKELSKIVVTDELKRLKETKRLYEEQTQLLSNIKFKIKNVKVTNEDEFSMIVTYQMPIIKIMLNEKGEPIERDPFFYSVNALEMVGLDDYKKIEDALNEAKARANNNAN